MTIDKFGTHISHKYSDKNGYYLCYLPLRVHDWQKTFVTQGGTPVLTYKINDLTNTWTYPLSEATVVRCTVFHFAIKFIINNKIVDSLEGETLRNRDTILVVRTENSLETGDGIIELVVKAPVSTDEYD